MIAITANPWFENARTEHLYICMTKQKYTDLTFAVRNRSFSVHMAVLSSCSDFFENNLNQLSDIFSSFDDIVIDAVLKYCYLGDIHIDESHLDKFMELANRLLIKNVVVEQKNPKYQTVDLSNCLEALWLSYNPITKNSAMCLTLDNFLTLYKTPEFLHLPASTLIDILKSDYLNAPLEEDVFKSVKLWTDYDRVNRKAVLPDLLSSVRLTLLSMTFLTSEVMVYCYSSPKCIIIVNEAMQLISSNRQNFILKNNHRKRSAKLAIFSTRHKTGVENTIDVYDRMNNKWTLTKDLGIDTFDFAPIVVDDWILMIGGQTNASAVDYIDLKDGKKYSLNPLNSPRFFCSAVKFLQDDSSTDVYVVGGAESWLQPLNTVERWNSKKRNWETNVAPMLLAVHSNAVSVVDGKIYVTGGCKLVKNELKVVDIVQVYSPQTNSWSYLKPMNQKRRVHKSAEINGRLFVVGGLKDIPILSVISSVESYDPGADLWTLICNLPSPRWGTAISLFGDKLLFMGGHNGTNYLADVLEYDVMNEKWCILRSLNMERSGGETILIPYNSFL